MAEASSDFSSRVASIANRLRLVQLDLADETSDTRREQLSDEIDRALASVMPEERAPFLEQLQEMFPTWDSNVAVAPRAEQAPGASRTDERELKDPAFLVSRLVELAPRLTDEQKEALGGRLRGAGLAPSAGGGGVFPDAAAEKLRARLQLVASTALDSARTVELAGMLTELAVSLDQVVWNTWKTLSPQSPVRRPGELHKTVGRFVVGDQDVARGQVKNDLERLRQLTAALIASVGQAGRQFAQRHMDRFGVEAIKDAAGPATFMKPQNVRCWEKYVELAGTMDAVSIERDLLQAIARYAEDLLKGLNR